MGAEVIDLEASLNSEAEHSSNAPVEKRAGAPAWSVLGVGRWLHLCLRKLSRNRTFYSFRECHHFETEHELRIARMRVEAQYLRR